MTDKERLLNEIHNKIIELYGESTRVEIAVTFSELEAQTFDRMNIRDYSMRRINGDWVEKR